MYIDIASLLRNALKASGCDESLLDDFDGHSTISLDFDQSPSILISVVDEHVWIWSRLCESTNAIIDYRGSDLLKMLISGSEFSITGQYQVAINDGYLELRGLIDPKYLEVENGALFANVLDDFFTQQERIIELIR